MTDRIAAGAAPEPIRVAIIGAGFAGLQHVDAVRRGGYGEIAALVGTDRERVRASARLAGVERVETDPMAVMADPSIAIVHICTPNVTHADLARAALTAGKHVVVEKPLGRSSADAREIVELAERTGRHAMVPFTYRGYPMVRSMRDLVARAGLGELRLVHGHYLQDWLARDSDFNWRIDPVLGGASRAIADIGSHWFDMAEWVAGDRVVEVFAELATFIPFRDRPEQATHAFERSSGAVERVEVHSEDAGLLLLRFAGGARGACVISQVSIGHQNDLSIEFEGAERSVRWQQEAPERIWIGSADAGEERWRTPEAVAAGTPHLPAGHPEGWGEALRDVLRPFYAAIAAGDDPPPRGAPAAYPTLTDGMRAATFVDAVLRSAQETRWVSLAAVDRG
jgi:predicted dehydrogenase